MLSGGLGLFFLLKALEEKVVFFYSPSETTNNNFVNGDTIRVGGLVMENSINYEDNMAIYFTITDNKKNLLVTYNGILPDLFREGQGVIVEGNMNKVRGVFEASRVLAKHDENYMPPEVTKAVTGDK